MSVRTKRIINYAIGIVVAAGVLFYVFVPVAPARLEYPTTTSNKPDTGVFYLTKSEVAVGKLNADISPDGVQGSPSVTIAYKSGGSVPPYWAVIPGQAATSVTVNGAAPDKPLVDGAVVRFDGTSVTYFAGRSGLLGFLDRLEADPTTHLFMSPHIISSAFAIVAAAFPVSVAFGVLGFVFAIPFGLLLAFMKMARTRWLRFPATLYVDIVRGTPLFLQILLVFNLIPLLPFYKDLIVAAPWLTDPGPLGVQGTYWMRGLIVLSFNSAAYMAEIFRAGIQSISKGQSEAARSLGMNAVQSMAFVILPQTVRRILPTMMSEFILLFKDTAMLSAVGLGEMVLRAREVASTAFNSSAYIVAAVFYLVLTIPLGRLVQNLENRLALAEGGGGHAGKREPMVPEPIDSDHVIAHSELLPGLTRPEPHRKDGRR